MIETLSSLEDRMKETCSLALFTLLQCADGILTYYGIKHTPAGIGYEANILIAAVMQWIGVAAGLTVMKFLSVALGLALYRLRNIEVFRFLSLLNVIMLTTLFAHLIVLTT